MFDSHENAARTLTKIREMGPPIHRSWKAQLFPPTTSMSFGEPSPTLVVRLGVRGTLEDAKRLFRDYDVPPEFMPLEIFLCKSCSETFRKHFVILC